jgi:PKD repeat protein
MGLYNGHDQTFYPNFAVNLPSSGADLFWHLDWATWNTSTSLGQLYSATSASPSSVAFSATNGGGGGFNQLRLFSRSSGSEVQTADIGFIKVYNGVLTLANVQSLYATYKTRFGYP